jgi:integrase/recombinase XerD
MGAESYTGRINRKLGKKLRIVEVAAGREKADLVLKNAVYVNVFSSELCHGDIAVAELLFATGIRISELCTLKPRDINLNERTVLIYGKGAKERKIQLGSDAVVLALEEYYQDNKEKIEECGYFFTNKLDNRLSEQSVREMINKYCRQAAISLHITPHMFRHSFATYLLEADVDIRYIQEMLGHSSINITEIYTHVAMAKQKDILTTKHPRKDFQI